MLDIIKKRLHEIICLFLEEEISYNDIANFTQLIAPISDVCDMTDALTIDAYMSMWHSSEKYCEVPKEELIYYKKCFEGNEIFSRETRDLIIRQAFDNRRK